MNSTGLSSAEAEAKYKSGPLNSGSEVKTKSIARIINENLFTLFNFVNLILALFVIFFGSYRNALFLGVALFNSFMGILQGIRAKRALDRLAIISAPTARVIRDGAEKSVAFGEVVTDDLMILSAGMQVCADAVVTEGECEADESLITGESDPVLKTADSELFSGSFVVSGYVKARAVRVGAESVSGKITSGSKHLKNEASEMMKSINRIIRAVSVCIFPFGTVLFIKAFFIAKEPLEIGVTGTVAALIGMIPEGLVLLTGIALSLGAVRLVKRGMLCRDLYCVEALARVDVLCLDKTGTLTEGRQEVCDVQTLDKNFDTDRALNAFAAAFPEPNPTLKAIEERFSDGSPPSPEKTAAFSSARKWSAAYFEDLGTLVLGAPSAVTEEPQIIQMCEKLSESGMRTLVLAHSPLTLPDGKLPEKLAPKAIIALSDILRGSAADTLEYFKRQGVAIKVISGDDPRSAAFAAHRAGIDGDYIDMTEVAEEKLPEIAEKYAVFGRCTPEQKQMLIKALKSSGHKVAMTGDGVNDVLALREADCSAAMQTGSDAARAVSQLVLMNGDFSSLPAAVAEGRRCIGNIRRSAALFLTKTVFSMLLTAVYLFLPVNYPLRPIQMTLIGASAIGIPSFLLALEHNTERVAEGFIRGVMKKALPCGISAAGGVLLLAAIGAVCGFSSETVSTISSLILAAACFGALFDVCSPLTAKRSVMFGSMILLFAVVAAVFPRIFYFVRLSALQSGITTLIIAIVLLAEYLMKFIAEKKNKPP